MYRCSAAILNCIAKFSIPLLGFKLHLIDKKLLVVCTWAPLLLCSVKLLLPTQQTSVIITCPCNLGAAPEKNASSTVILLRTWVLPKVENTGNAKTLQTYDFLLFPCLGKIQVLCANAGAGKH